MADVLKSSREGDIVISKVQTAGRGRENRIWFSQIGGLWLTVTLTPPRSEFLDKIPTIATSAIVESLQKFGLSDCLIKLPNDVYSGGKKIAGVLADASVTDSSSVVYLGIGINVNNDPSIVNTISETATSVRNLLGREMDLMEFTATFMETLDFEYGRLLESH